ncbi:hypothetical protein [uncultured Parabacteroides sp.]|jgi:hypothetical protein|uniref:hypothetical protein n=1 Tax=uncultured Parabacteroides sp. TaxID=512312 RepID=UPI00258A2985|nr:hypothetical protein [uncultured Parabacteroides sp.]
METRRKNNAIEMTRALPVDSFFAQFNQRINPAQIHFCHNESRNWVTQTQLVEQSPRKGKAVLHHESCRQKLAQPLSQTNLLVFHLVRTVDNKLLCLENGRMLPLTNQGEIDSDQLALEIASRKW